MRVAPGQQKIKIVRTNRQSNLRGSCQSIFSLSRHHPTSRPAMIMSSLTSLKPISRRPLSQPHSIVVPRQFSQDIGEWPENQILIPDWTYFHCPDTTLILWGRSNTIHSSCVLARCLKDIRKGQAFQFGHSLGNKRNMSRMTHLATVCEDVWDEPALLLGWGV